MIFASMMNGWLGSQAMTFYVKEIDVNPNPINLAAFRSRSIRKTQNVLEPLGTF
jgi:hypothetical protein